MKWVKELRHRVAPMPMLHKMSILRHKVSSHTLLLLLKIGFYNFPVTFGKIMSKFGHLMFSSATFELFGLIFFDLAILYCPSSFLAFSLFLLADNLENIPRHCSSLG